MKHNYLKLFYLCIFTCALISFKGLAQASTPYDITAISTKIDLSTTATSPNAVWDVEVFVVLTDITNSGSEQLTSIAFYNPWSISDMTYPVNITGHTINNLLPNTEYSVKFRIVTEDTFTELDSSFDTNSLTFTTLELTKAYVNINATGSNNGTSWTNAYTSLQSAIDGTQADGDVWVAAGTYVPTASPDNVSTDNRDYAFHLDKNLKIYGGFAGTETLLNERTSGNTSILSGDLDNDDDISDNSYHVFITDELNNTSTIDGFTITKGNANGSGNITYSGNTYNRNTGGGIMNNLSSPNLSNLIITDNATNFTGGGMYNTYASPALSNITLSKNTANYGAGMYNSVSSPTMTNTAFSNNNASTQGGGLENFFYSSPTLINVVFAGNKSTASGAGIHNNNNCSPSINNATFFNNTNTGIGAGIYNNNSSNPVINNTVFYQNKANSVIDDIYNTTSTPTGNNNASDHINAPSITVTLTSNPFLNATEPDGIDALFGTTDDGLRLVSTSNLINIGNNAYNTESLDISGRVRINETTIDIGAYEDLSYTWTGATDNNWETTSNWNKNIVPTSTIDVYIPSDLTNYPTATGAVTFNNMTIASGASFIPQGAVTGNVTYKRTITDTNWHLISSPVSGATIEDYIYSSSLATGTGANIGLSTYVTGSTPAWNYYTSSSTGTFVNGQGFSTKLSTASDISFTGTLNTSNITYAIYNGTNSFNLVGNPFTAYINSDVFTTDNTSLLFEKTIWVWDGTEYKTYNSAETLEIAPGQAFFVEAKASNFATFNTTNRSHQNTDTFMRQESKSNIELFVENNGIKKSTKVFFIEGKTSGYDSGYDSKIFGGTAYDFAVFTELVSDNEGNKLAIQSLGKDDTSVIPVGVIAKAGEELTFSIESLNLPEGTELYLEDKSNNEFTNLSKRNYKTILTEDANGIGQFYITTSEKSLTIDDITNANISIYKSAINEITIAGIASETKVSIFSLLGEQIVKTSINNSTNKVNLPNVSTGVYIVKLTSENGEMTKKITL